MGKVEEVGREVTECKGTFMKTSPEGSLYQQDESQYDIYVRQDV